NAGIALEGRSLDTKNDFRLLHTFTNMGPSPEPNLTVLYSEHLREGFSTYASRIAIESSSIHFENVFQVRDQWGCDHC
ncbi:pyruvate formate lyase family protein, partial [Enterococcus faecium]|uniref:pyruvate formate lyase family protein n=1 Tax=Enterococcus faecium TaxID=1352 RepID=UPI003CC640B4